MQVIYGINPLREVFFSHPEMLEKVVVADRRGGNEVRKILKLAAEHGIPVEFGGRERVENLAPRQVHQGVAGICREHAYATVDEVIAHRHEKSKYDLVVLLDSVTDPQNLGSIIRTAHCCGANGVIIPGNRDAVARMDIQTPDYEGNIALVMGSEGRGIRPLIRKKCDFLISIPMRGQVASLNVSVAAGVILFEILRKWGN